MLDRPHARILGRSLVDLGRNECRWPVGEGEDGQHLFCADPRAKAGKPYCAHHLALAYPAPVVRPRRAKLHAMDAKAAASGPRSDPRVLALARDWAAAEAFDPDRR